MVKRHTLNLIGEREPQMSVYIPISITILFFMHFFSFNTCMDWADFLYHSILPFIAVLHLCYKAQLLETSFHYLFSCLSFHRYTIDILYKYQMTISVEFCSCPLILLIQQNVCLTLTQSFQILCIQDLQLSSAKIHLQDVA